MYRGKKILALIPARGGSKRLPNKNILKLSNKPLIGWTIEAAKKSKYIDQIFISTDSPEIKDVAESFDCNVPYLRSKSLSTDSSTTLDVAIDVIHKFRKDQVFFDYLILLQPTSPLRKESHIDEAIEVFFEKKANSIISVSLAEHSSYWVNTIPKDGSMTNFLRKEFQNKRRQDLPKEYRLNGAIYLISIESLIHEKSFFTKEKSYAYIMEFENSIDIDSVYDFELAQIILKSQNKKPPN